MNPEPRALPKLAVLWNEGSLPALQIAEAADGVAHLAWVIDDRVDPSSRRLLDKVGDVIPADPTSDVTRVATALRRARCDGLVTFTDIWQRFGARLASELGLPFLSEEVAARLSDKLRQRTCLRDAGVTVPRFAGLPAAPRPDDIEAALRTVRLPGVLKPRAGWGSRNTVRVDDDGELRKFLAEADEPSGWLVEEFLASQPAPDNRPWDDLVSVESVVQAGRVDHLAVTGRFPFVPPFRDTGGFLPADLASDERAAVEAVAEQSIRAVGIVTGACHTEVKLTVGGPRVIEVNGRVGGHVPDLLALVGGPPIVRWAMRLALGEAVDARPQPLSSVAFFLCEQPPPAAVRLAELTGVEKVLAIDGVTRASAPILPGAAVDWRSGVDGYVFAAEGVVPDHATLWECRERILAAVLPRYLTQE